MRIDVSVAQDGTTLSVVLRGEHSSVRELLDVFEGIYFTASNSRDMTPILKLKGKDLKLIEGAPNEYIRDIVVARDNSIRSPVQFSYAKEMRGKTKAAALKSWRNRLPFLVYFTPNDAATDEPVMISRLGDKTTIIQTSTKTVRQTLMSGYEQVIRHVNDLSYGLLCALIDKAVTIGEEKYNVAEALEEDAIFRLVPINEDENDVITIKRAYYTDGQHHNATFIFSEGDVENAKGFIVIDA
eukprot:GHVS01016839.1.p1 GENE.GHVS01016839.1~~GHVS01016839.1.p1  ORF type:complete len:241 (-),score=30.06 GHVS01016839.1:139-861(-)